MINSPRNNHTQHRRHSHHPKKHHPSPRTPHHIPPPAPPNIIPRLDPAVKKTQHRRDPNGDVKCKADLVRPHHNVRDQRRQTREVREEEGEGGFVGVSGARIRVRLEAHDELDFGSGGEGVVV